MIVDIYAEIAHVVTKGQVKRIAKMLDPRKRDEICEKDRQEDDCKSMGKLGKEYDSVKKKIGEMIISCILKKEKVTELVEEIFGLGEIFELVKNDDEQFHQDYEHKQVFVGEIVKQLIVGEHMSNLLGQDYASQRDFLPQTFDELLENSCDNQIAVTQPGENQICDSQDSANLGTITTPDLRNDGNWLSTYLDKIFYSEYDKPQSLMPDLQNDGTWVSTDLDNIQIFDFEHSNSIKDLQHCGNWLSTDLDKIFYCEQEENQNLSNNAENEIIPATNENPSLTVLVHFNGSTIGKLCLHGDQVKADDPTKSFMARQTSSSIVPIPITAEIRKTIRMFPFENYDDDMQNFGTISLCGKIFKMYQLYVDNNEPISIATFKDDTVESLLIRLDQIHSNVNRKVVGIYADHKLLKQELNVWKTIETDDKLFLSFGKSDATQYSVEGKSVFLQAFDDTQICVDILDDEYSDSFLNRITTLLEAQSYRIIFNYRTKRIVEGKLMSEYNIEDGDVVHFSLPSVGGTGRLYLSIDLTDASITTGQGTNAEYGYTFGLNVIGKCKNSNCPSSGNIVYYNLGYPAMEIMNPERNEYICPRCFEQEITVDTFLMAAGRAKFVFRKIGQKNDKIVLLESPSPDHSYYSKFSVNDDQRVCSGVEYDFVRIYTVKFDLSFDKCHACDRGIHLNEQEVMKCGRAFHKSCLTETNNGKCPTCNLPELTLNQVKSMVSGKTDASVNLKVSNNIYQECSITYTNQDNLEKRSLRDFIKCMNRNHIVSKRYCSEIIDLQQRFVDQNLDQLVKTTKVGTSLLAFLTSRNVIHSQDEEFLESFIQEQKRARETYKILTQRLDGLKVMYEACENTKQSGAVAVLTNFIFKMKSKFKNLFRR